MNEVMDIYGIALISGGIAAGIFYVVGFAHGIEQERKRRRADKTYYKCCDHCYGPDGELSGEHFHPAWEERSNKPILKMDTHRSPCTEDGCVSGRTVANVIYG